MSLSRNLGDNRFWSLLGTLFWLIVNIIVNESGSLVLLVIKLV